MAQAQDAFSVARQCFAQGRWTAAKEACRDVLDRQPRHAEALNLLGGIECELGRFADAIEAIGQALALRPAEPNWHRNLGFVHWRAGNVDQAIDCYRRCLDLNPQDAQAHNNLGVALKEKGWLDEAALHFQAALRLEPDLAFPHRNLAEVRYQQGQRQQALFHYDLALRLDPNDAETRNGLGSILAAVGRPAEAIEQFEAALRLRPEYAEAETNFATVLRLIGRLDEAVAHCRSAVRLRPDLADAHVGLGCALQAQGHSDDALVHVEAGLRLEPNHANAHNTLGSVLTSLGRFAEAVTHLESAIRLNPDLVFAYHHLSELALHDKYRFSDNQVSHMKALLAGDRPSVEEAVLLRFTLGDICHKQGRYDEAFDYFQQANDTQQALLEAAGVAFDQNAHRDKIDRTIRYFQRNVFHQAFHGRFTTETPIFVVGMPRSGTTLVEQIISSHPDAAGAGELKDIRQLADELPSLVGGHLDYPDCLSQADADTIRNLAERYWKRLTERSPQAQRVVDKMWANFTHLGFIAMLFPKARVIHCRRDPMDVGLSCYMSNFNAIRWAWRLEDIGFFYRDYARLMDHWRGVLPLPMHDVVYEELVGDFAGVSKQLIRFCGLEWDDRCLNFHRNRQPVQTASRVQVRQPIYNTSIGRWKKYEVHLLPLQRALGDHGPSSSMRQKQPQP